MTREQRAEQLMRKGPIQNVRRIIELEDELDQAYIATGKLAERTLLPGWWKEL